MLKIPPDNNFVRYDEVNIYYILSKLISKHIKVELWECILIQLIHIFIPFLKIRNIKYLIFQDKLQWLKYNQVNLD